MLAGDHETRLNEILDMIGCMAALNFSKNIEISDKYDMIDAIASGLNMLSEELNTQVVTKAKLDEVNLKLEKFAYTTAHDLKSPINTSTALIQLIEMSLSKSDNTGALGIIEKLKITNANMQSLVEGILLNSRTSSEEIILEEVDFNKLFKEVIELDGINGKADVIIESELPNVFFNKISGMQIARNLMDNAVKYSDKERCEIKIKSKELIGHYEVAIQDNGPGIKKEFHKAIFEPFNQVVSNTNSLSTGIGLSTVKNIIENNGGQIWLNSSMGKGTTFFFTLTKMQNDE